MNEKQYQLMDYVAEGKTNKEAAESGMARRI